MKINSGINIKNTIREMLFDYKPPGKGEEAYITDRFAPEIFDNALEHIKFEYNANYQDVVSCAVHIGLRKMHEYDSTRRVIAKCKDIITGNTHKQGFKFKSLIEKNYFDFGEKKATSRISAYIHADDSKSCGSFAKDIGIPGYMMYRVALSAGMVNEPIIRIFEKKYFINSMQKFGEWITEHALFAIDVIKKHELNTTFRPEIDIDQEDVFCNTINKDEIQKVLDLARDL